MCVCALRIEEWQAGVYRGEECVEERGRRLLCAGVCMFVFVFEFMCVLYVLCMYDD
jgi:hypothetical protein